MKKKYDKNVKNSITFVSKQLIFFKNIDLLYDKYISKWNESFIIVNYNDEHRLSYKFTKLNDKKTFNI